jgi:GNAT superfamily N-acetyltransferase
LQETTLNRDLKRATALKNCGPFTGHYPYRRNIECMHAIFDNHGTAYAVAHRRLDEQAVVYTVHAGDHLELVARAVFDVAGSSVSEMLVWPGWHRRGVAAALYRLIEWEHGQALRPSRARRFVGQAFWASRGIDLSA